MRLPQDILSGNYVCPRIFLCETNKEKICQLKVSEPKGAFKLNAYSEFSFEVGRVYNDLITGEQTVNPHYDKIEAIRLIYLEDIGYFELQGPELIGDGIKEAKSCTAYSLEYTLSQKYLDDFYINTGEIGSVEVTYAEENNQDIIPVTLYNPSNEKLSLLHLVLEKIYGWKIGHVDLSLQKLSRQFEIDRSSVYDFLMNDVCEKFNCYIVFDTIDNTINFYAESLTAKFIGDGVTNRFAISPPFSQIGTVSVDGYKTTRWDYNSSTGVLILDDIPESGAHIEVVDGALIEWETDVFVTFDNLAQEININYDADSIKTVLTVTYGDGNDIRETNLGLPYLTDISYYYTVDWMGQDLYDAYTKYLQKSNSYQLQYTNNSQEMLDWAGRIDFEENRLSLGYSIVQSVSSSTVGTYYVRGGTSPNYYYTEVSLPSEYDANTTYYRLDTANLSETKVSNLFTVLKKHFNNEDDWEEKFDELSRDFQFMETYTFAYLKDALQNAVSLANKEAAINNFLGEMWNEIGRTPLKKLYYEPYKKVQLTNIEAGWSHATNEKYWYYYPVVLYLDSIEKAIAERENLIKEYTNEYNTISQKNIAIADELLMTKNFTEDQLIRLSAFLREDELQLDDIVATSQDTIADSFKVKQDAMESGRIELNKLCRPQLQFSMSMANIYALPEFEPIVNQFQLGNVIKVGLRPDYIMQSRLLQVDINFEDFSDFSCEFGELTTLRTQSDIHADLLSQAISAGKSVATNSSYWTKGADKSGQIQQNIEAGLLDAVTSIKAIDGTQGVEIDKYGIHLTDVNPNTGEVDPKQGWITNNKFLYTDDGFKSTKSVFGEFTYDGNTYYGILAEALVGSLIVGTQIEIGNAYGTMKFDDNGLSVTNGTNSFAVDPNSETLLSLSNETGKIFYVDEKGMLHIKGDGAGLDITNNDTVNGIYNEFQVTKEGILSTTRKELADVKDDTYEYIGTVESTFKKTADEISASVKEETERAEATEEGLRKTIEEKSAEWSVTAEEIKGSVKDVKTTLENDYLTTEQTESKISQKAGEISSTVSSLQTSVDGLAQKVNYYGTCTTGSSTVKKVVSCPDFHTLTKGTTISVKFSYKNTANAPTLSINNGEMATSATPIYAYNNTLSSDSTYNWSNNSVVIFVYDGSYWRISDSGALYQTSSLSSRISQTESDITLEVERATAAENTLASKVVHYGTCSTAASTIEKAVTCSDFSLYKGATISVRFSYANTAASPTLNVNSTGAKTIKAYGSNLSSDSTYNWSANSVVSFVYDGSYWRLADSGALSRIKITADGITSTVSDLNNTVNGHTSLITQNKDSIALEVTRAKKAENDLSAKIQVNKDSISSKVGTDQIGTYIQQSAEAVRIAWNNSNNYIEFASGEINMYTSTSHSTSTLFAKYNNSGAHYYRGGSNIGKIGTNTLNTLNIKGLVFDLNYGDYYMAWAHKESSTATSYTAQMLYFAKDFDATHKKGMHFDSDVYLNSDTYLDSGSDLYICNDVCLTKHTGGSGTIYCMDTSGNSSNNKGIFLDALRSDGYVTRFSCFSDKFKFSASTSKIIDCGGNSLTNQSDVRLKTNIQNTKVEALKKMNQIELKEFNWIEDGEYEEIGIIAQQLRDIIPDLVYEDPATGKLSIKITKFIPYLIKSIQELSIILSKNKNLKHDFNFIDSAQNITKWSDTYDVSDKKDFINMVECCEHRSNGVQKTKTRKPITIPIN